MSQSARVYSVERISRLHAALARFGVGAQTALSTAALELRRAQEGLEDRKKFWQQQVYRRQEEVSQARAALTHARALSPGRGVGCVEQELALRHALARLREAEDKVAACRRWIQALPEAARDFEALARGLSGRLETDLRQSLALLEAKVASLEAYLALRPPEPPAPPAPADPEPQALP